MASALIAKLLGAVFRIPLTAALGGTGMGYYSCAYGLFLPVFALSVTGINTAAAALTARYYGENRPRAAQRVIRLALRLFGIGGLAGGAVLFCTANLICTRLLQNPGAALAVRSFAPAVWFCCISAVLRGEAEGLRQMTPTAVSQIAEGFGRVGCGLALCFAALRFPQIWQQVLPQGTQSAEAAAAAAILGVTLSAAIGTAVMLLARRRLIFPAPTGTEALPADRVLLRDLVQLLLPIAAASLVTNLTTLIDTATAIRLLSAFAAKNAETEPPADTANFLFGAYSGLAVTVFNLVPSVTNMLGKGVLPAFSHACAQNRLDETAQHAEAVLRRTAFLAVPSGFGIAVLAEPILRLLFSGRPDEAQAAALPLAVLGVAVIFTALSFPLFSMLQAAGAAGTTVTVMLVGAAVKLLANLLLIPRLGPVGAAAATVLSYAVILVGAASVFRRVTGIAVKLLRICALPLLGGCACAFAARTVFTALNGSVSPAAALFAAVAAGGACHLTVCLPRSLVQMLDKTRRRDYNNAG